VVGLPFFVTSALVTWGLVDGEVVGAALVEAVALGVAVVVVPLGSALLGEEELVGCSLAPVGVGSGSAVLGGDEEGPVVALEPRVG